MPQMVALSPLKKFDLIQSHVPLDRNSAVQLKHNKPSLIMAEPRKCSEFQKVKCPRISDSSAAETLQRHMRVPHVRCRELRLPPSMERTKRKSADCAANMAAGLTPTSISSSITAPWIWWRSGVLRRYMALRASRLCGADFMC